MTDQEKLKLIEISMMELAPLYGAIKAAASSIKDVDSLALTETISKLEEAAKLIDAADDDIVDVTYDVEIDEEALRERGEFKLKTKECLKEACGHSDKIEVIITPVEYDSYRVRNGRFIHSKHIVEFKDIDIGDYNYWDLEIPLAYALSYCYEEIDDKYIELRLEQEGITKESEDYDEARERIIDEECFEENYDLDTLQKALEFCANDGGELSKWLAEESYEEAQDAAYDAARYQGREDERYDW